MPKGLAQLAFSGELAAFFGPGQYDRPEVVQQDVSAVHVIVSAAFRD
jgi:hypothetical protein